MGAPEAVTKNDSMPPAAVEQSPLRIGVDVGGTFTDLVCFDPDTNELNVVKIPSTPPDFHVAVIEAVRRVLPPGRSARIVHGSTVATNALLERRVEPCAFVTTEGFRDLLLIGRQNRPHLYALHVQRPRPLIDEANWFTVRERIAAGGQVVEPLSDREVAQLIERIRSRGLRHVAVCLLFSFVNPAHEQLIGRQCAEAALSVSLSSQILPEFREYERASTTAINAALRPTVEQYLKALSAELEEALGFRVQGSGAATVSPLFPNPEPRTLNSELRIMHSGGGSLSVHEASSSAAKLILSGPAGGVIGGAFVAAAEGFRDAITYDMGGTSTDVATVLDGQPQWTTSSTVDGLPIGLPAFDIQTVGAGGGSVACLDGGGALRVGPHSAGAVPGPACYGRGGTEPTVTDANLLLGRIFPDQFAGGAMRIDPDLARRAIEPLARAMGKSPIEAALGIIRVVESNMSRAIRAVTSRRGLDPRRFTLVSFGGAGGLHACALAEALEIPRVLVPPYCGVLSALGMIVAPPIAEASQTVVHLGDQLDDDRLAAEFGRISGKTMEAITYEQTASVQAFADVRFRGQSHEVTVPVDWRMRENIGRRFLDAYGARYGHVPTGRAVEIVTLRVRRVARHPELRLPPLDYEPTAHSGAEVSVVVADGTVTRARAVIRNELSDRGPTSGPFLLIDRGATAWVPPRWEARRMQNGSVVLNGGPQFSNCAR